MRTSTRSADSGFAFSEAAAPSSHSDTELRYQREELEARELPRGASLPRMRPSPKKRKFHTGSLERKHNNPSHVLESALVDPMLLAKTPILCNKYVVEAEKILNHVPTTLEVPRNGGRRATSMPRTTGHLAPPRDATPRSSREDLDSIRDAPRKKRPRRKKRPTLSKPNNF